VVEHLPSKHKAKPSKKKKISLIFLAGGWLLRIEPHAR
jgi:hypothetical protein